MSLRLCSLINSIISEILLSALFSKQQLNIFSIFHLLTMYMCVAY